MDENSNGLLENNNVREPSAPVSSAPSVSIRSASFRSGNSLEGSGSALVD